MKVCYLIPSLRASGPSRMLSTLVVGVKRLGIDAQVVVLREPGETLRRRMEDLGVSVIDLAVPKYNLLRGVSAVRGVLAQSRPDILHTHCPEADVMGMLAARGLGLSGIVFTLHAPHVRLAGRSCGLLNYLLALAYNWLADGKVCCVPVSRSVLAAWKRRGLRVSSRVIHSGVANPGACSPLTNGVIGAVTSLATAKGSFQLLDVFHLCLNQLDSVSSVVIGDGPDRERVLRRADPRIRFTGLVEEPYDYLSGIDVFVSMSRTEGLPIALLEAMSCGVPVVSTSVGGVSEAIIPGYNGYLVEPGDVEGAVNCVIRLCRDHSLRQELGRNARAVYTAHFSADVMAREYVEQYKRLQSGSVSSRLEYGVSAGHRSGPCLE